MGGARECSYGVRICGINAQATCNTVILYLFVLCRHLIASLSCIHIFQYCSCLVTRRTKNKIYDTDTQTQHIINNYYDSCLQYCFLIGHEFQGQLGVFGV